MLVLSTFMSCGAATVMPVSFKNWLVHMEELHRRSSNTAVTNMQVSIFCFWGKTLFNLWISLSKLVNSEIDINPLRTDFHPLLFHSWWCEIFTGCHACAKTWMRTRIHIWPQVCWKSSIPQAWLIRNAQCRPHPSHPPTPRLLDGVLLGVRECMNALLGLLELIPAVS